MLQIPETLKKYASFLQSTRLPCNEISFEIEDTLPWESKLGGCPYLEDLKDYPLDTNEQPMIFLAQINFSEMPPLPDFPTEGILQFFIANDDLLGLDGDYTLRYYKKWRKENLVLENPYEEDYMDFAPFSQPGKIKFTPREMPITAECDRFIQQFPDDLPEQEELFNFCYAEGCRVGGYPNFVQNAPAYYDDGTCDVLLLQLDIDDTCGIMFGDAGNCNFFISKEDLKALDFSKAEYEWQCC